MRRNPPAKSEVYSVRLYQTDETEAALMRMIDHYITLGDTKADVLRRGLMKLHQDEPPLSETEVINKLLDVIGELRAVIDDLRTRGAGAAPPIQTEPDEIAAKVELADGLIRGIQNRAKRGFTGDN